MALPIIYRRGPSTFFKGLRLSGSHECTNKFFSDKYPNSPTFGVGSVRLNSCFKSLNSLSRAVVNNGYHISFCQISSQNVRAATTGSSQPGSTGLADELLRAKAAAESNDKATPGEPTPEEERKKLENSARAVKFTLYAMGVMIIGAGLYMFFVWGAPIIDRRGREVRDEFSDLPYFEQRYKRAMSEITTSVKYITDPSREKLLPDPLPPHKQPPYTLILELTGFLVHPDWTYKTGWRFKKRPGVDYFLMNLAGYFEIVLYTQEAPFTAFPIMDALDKQGVVMSRLYRDSTKYTDGVHVKDLDRINRDLSKVIVIDWNGNAVKDHRTNAIVLPKWNGNDDDRTLYDLVALLKTISANEISDVRVVLEHYAKFDDPIAEFRKKQLLLAQAEQETAGKDKSPGLHPGWVINMFRTT